MQRRSITRTLASLALGSLATLGTLCTPLAQAEEPWPSKSIRFVVPYPPGGPTDLMARLLQGEMQTRLGVSVIVDNKSGAGGNLGSAEVARQAPADGHTLLLAASGPMAVNSSLYKSMPFNPLKDLEPVVQLSAFPLVLEVHPSLGVKTVAELLALAKTGKTLSFASAGNGTPQHLAGELFNSMEQVKLGHVPYRGAGPALNDLIGGQVGVMFDIVGSSLQHIQGGRLIPLAVTSAERTKVLPDVPTMAEVGYPQLNMSSWTGIAAPAGTPDAIVQTLYKAIRQAATAPAMVASLKERGVVAPEEMSPAAFEKMMAERLKLFGEVVRKAHIVAE